jgi:hypothetical protein
LWANSNVAGFNWDPGSFVFAWVLIAGVGFAYKLITRKSGTLAYRLGTGLALATGFMLVWINAAVGFIGSEDNPANLLYGAVLAIAAIGAAIGRFSAEGMVWAMLVAALAQMLVPAIALMFRPQDFSPGVLPVFMLNSVFALLFAASAWLFKLAAAKRRPTAEQRPT